MDTKKDEFAEALFSEWLPSFCEPRGRAQPEGFVRKNLDTLSEFDAHWFLRALEEGYVREACGIVSSDMGKATEKILWPDIWIEGLRKVHLALEPIITRQSFRRRNPNGGWRRNGPG